jgi:hypothetical protein
LRGSRRVMTWITQRALRSKLIVEELLE